MDYRAINLDEKLDQFSALWSPKNIASLNGYHVKLVKIRGEFVWHSHSDTDELFMVLDGSMAIDFRDGRVELKAGEMFVVPRGVEHKPVAEVECSLMLIEPAGLVNTGDAGGEMTAPTDVWI